jgi:thioredoxin 1
MASEAVQVFTDQDFDREVIKSTIPVLVDFSAEWCGPCKALAPIVAEVARELAGKVKFGTVNVDDSPGVAARYGVRSLPTLLLFKQGAVAAKHAGTTTKAKLREFVGP